MAGLLDLLNSEQGVMALSLLSAARPQPGPRDFGGGLLQALGAGQQFRAAQDAKKEREQDRAMRQQQFQLQQQQMQQALAEQMRMAQQREADTTALRGQFGALPGPTIDGSQLRRGFDPAGMLQSGASPQAIQQAMQLNQIINPQPEKDDFKVVGNSLVRVPRSGAVSEAYRAPDKPEAPDEFTRALQAAGIAPNSPQAQQLALQRLTKMATHPAPASVSVNTGQKGLDNTLKLRGDFRSEPIYKAHQATEAAYGQIKQSLSQASPAGDMAGATKIMKLLDPDSVVRESELAMAMGATGALDRLTNYADQVVKGVKLNPAQRKDFQLLADKLYSESSRLYNAKRSEYEGIAKRNQLPVEDVLGSPSTPQVSNRRVVRTGTQNGRRVVQYDDGSIEHAD